MESELMEKYDYYDICDCLSMLESGAFPDFWGVL